MKTLDAKCVLEAAILCAGQPMPMRDMQALFADTVEPDTLRRLLDEIAQDCAGRGFELVGLASGWRFQSRPEVREHLARLSPDKPARASRALLETLAIIAYRQPVTRGDIEDIRGVSVASHIVKQLEDRGWVESIGTREAPGRPGLLATTKQFLDDLGLAGLDQLPLLDGDGSSSGMADVFSRQPSLLDLQPGEASTSVFAMHDGTAHQGVTAELLSEVDLTDRDPSSDPPTPAAPAASPPSSPTPFDPALTAAPLEPHA